MEAGEAKSGWGKRPGALAGEQPKIRLTETYLSGGHYDERSRL